MQHSGRPHSRIKHFPVRVLSTKTCFDTSTRRHALSCHYNAIKMVRCISVCKCRDHFEGVVVARVSRVETYRRFANVLLTYSVHVKSVMRWSQWPRGLRRRSTAARLLTLWVRIPPGAWMSVCCEWCVLSGRGLCNELTHPEESYRMWCIVVCYLETSRMRRPWPGLGRSATGSKKKSRFYKPFIMQCTVHKILKQLKRI